MSYDPLGEELGDTENLVAANKQKRASRRSAKAVGGGLCSTLGIVALVFLLVAVVVLAIALPVTFTRRMQQDAANAAAPPTAARSAGESGSAAAASNGAGAPATAGASPSAGGADAGTSTNDVFCYVSIASGRTLEGSFHKTGRVSTEDGVRRAEVRSCGSGALLFLLETQLQPCTQPCVMPIWRAVQLGLVQRPIWTHHHVCRGDQVYENRMEPRYTFYLRFAGFVEEQLISRCDSNDGWWVPNAELSICPDHLVVACQEANLKRTTPRNSAVLVDGVPAGTSVTPRPVCVRAEGATTPQAQWATGTVTNAWVWSRFRFMDQVETVPCGNRTAGERTFAVVDDIEPCSPTAAQSCVVAPAASNAASKDASKDAAAERP